MKKAIYFIGLFWLIGLILPWTVFAIGQMTKPIIIKDVLRGQEVTATLILFNSEDKEAIYQLKAEGAIADWASFYKIDDKDLANPTSEITLPPKSHLDAIVKFNIPKDIPNSEYTGEVAVISGSAKDQEKDKVTVGVFERVSRAVSITVTDQEVIKFNATIIPLTYGIGENESLKIKVIYENQGNVAIKPDFQLKIIQVSNGKIVHNAIYPYPENEKPVKPLERETFENLIEWPAGGQDNGKYKAEIKALFNNKTYYETSFRFQIGFDQPNKFLAALSALSGGNLTLAWFIIGGILLLIAGILIFFQKSKKLKNQNINKDNEG